ncbi:AAA family ATPase [Azospirillum sp. SYSU D00513]|uniref:AAA family ATPase n=1 Tax=Azospirillum sp. SYSU D00513 TaxID=2812561 RepID=UPI001A961992|nr:AAA family ATPase [Azospirillum sp. SYSU D00513]
MTHSEFTGEAMKAFREANTFGQEEFALWLNEQIGRKYDRNRISRWENGNESIPANVKLFLLDKASIAPRGTSIPAPVLIRTDGDKARAATKLAVVNQKGGVGKTTCTVNLGYLLASKGLRVLVVDADAQANATAYLGADGYALDQEERTLYHVILKDKPTADSIIRVCDGLFGLLPSSLRLSQADAELAADPNSNLLLREKLNEVEGEYDIIIIDCPPNLGHVTINALNCSDYVLVPVQTEPMAALGIPMLHDTLSKVKRRVNPKVEILGILPTMFAASHSVDQVVLGQIKELWGDRARIFTPIPSSTLYPQSSYAGQPTLMGEPKAAGAGSYHEVSDALIALMNEQRQGAANV